MPETPNLRRIQLTPEAAATLRELLSAESSIRQQISMFLAGYLAHAGIDEPLAVEEIDLEGRVLLARPLKGGEKDAEGRSARHRAD